MKICVHSFCLADVEDPEIYAGEPLLTWQNSDQGKWVMEHSIQQPYFKITPDHNTYGYKCGIFANLTDEDYTFFKLKWA